MWRSIRTEISPGYRPSRIWNRIPDKVRDEIIQLALDEPELSPRELSARFVDTKGYLRSAQGL